MNIGQLKYRAEVQAVTSTDTGNTYTKVRDQWIGIEPLSSNRIVFLSAQGSKVTHLILAREKPALEIGQRLVTGGRNYNIIAVQTFLRDRQEAQAELLQ